jgi:hypothetical protein
MYCMLRDVCNIGFWNSVALLLVCFRGDRNYRRCVARVVFGSSEFQVSMQKFYIGKGVQAASNERICNLLTI